MFGDKGWEVWSRTFGEGEVVVSAEFAVGHGESVRNGVVRLMAMQHWRSLCSR